MHYNTTNAELHMPEQIAAAKGPPEALKGALILTKVRYARYYIKPVPLKSAISSHLT